MGIYEFNPDDARQFAYHIHASVKERNGQLQFKECPYCHSEKDSETFAIDLKTGKFKCLRSSCSIQGNMITLSKDFNFSLGNEVDEYFKPKKKFRTFKKPEKPIEPKESALKYLESRGISEETARKYQITAKKNNEDILVFPFIDEKGNIQLIKYRDTKWFPEKTWTDSKGEVRKSPKERCEKDCKKILFGMYQCNNNFDQLVITEGQMDSLSVAESGIENAVSVPTGKNGFTWVPYCWDWFSKFESLVVFGDMENGQMTLLEDLKKRFPGKLKYVQEEDYKDCKDANEILKKYGKDAVKQAVENAIPIPVKCTKQYSDIKRPDLSKIHKIKTGFSELDGGILNGGLYAGQLVILTGKRGIGKSSVAGQIMANALGQGNKVFSYSGELPDWQFRSWVDRQIVGPSYVIENRDIDGSVNRFVSTKNYDIISDWTKDRFFIYDKDVVNRNEKEDLIKVVTNSVMQYGINLVVLDNLMTVLNDLDTNANRFEAQGDFCNDIAALGKQLGFATILVAHPKKDSLTTDENDAVSGNSQITDAADIVMTFKKGSDNEIDGDSQRFLSISKNRWFGHLTKKQGIEMFYDERSMRLNDGHGDVNRNIGWDYGYNLYAKDGFETISDEDTPFN